jgi:hypothetical protein
VQADGCVLAACNLHDAAQATAWLRRVAHKKRDAALASCKRAGTTLATVPSKGSGACTDPFACQQ